MLGLTPFRYPCPADETWHILACKCTLLLLLISPVDRAPEIHRYARSHPHVALGVKKRSSQGLTRCDQSKMRGEMAL